MQKIRFSEVRIVGVIREQEVVTMQVNVVQNYLLGNKTPAKVRRML